MTPRSEKQSEPISATRLNPATTFSFKASGLQTATQTAQKSQPALEKFIAGNLPSAIRITCLGHCVTHSPQRLQVSTKSSSPIDQGGRMGGLAEI